ncbi:MAG: PilZ domain-containing protein [Planctomycetota bacterium]|jgi:hypothetical protein
MVPSPIPDRDSSGNGGAERRVHGRRRQQMLMSSLGPVLDLSLGGMRVTATRRLRGSRTVHLMTDEGPVPVKTEVAWSRRTGFMQHEVGLKFVELDALTAKALTAISSRFQYFYGHVA